ncbi:MAG: Hemolysin-type calcium-binding region [Myxococcales bacterium]|nr:Hemolysin-type calcium-binding region [Myxococcales bacterium]
MTWRALAIALVSACGPTATSTVCKEPLIAGDLVITEVFSNFQATGGGADAGREWFEIYNASDRPLDLQGLRIVHSRPDGSQAQSHKMRQIAIAPGQFFTLGNTTQDRVAPYVDYGYSTDLGDLYNDAGGKLALQCGAAEIDSATYDHVKVGHSRELSAANPPDYTFNDDPINWCEGKDSEFEAGNFGTPGQDNDCVPVISGQCNDSGTPRDVVPASAGDLVITEVMPSPTKASDAVGEWIEAKAIRDVDLNGIGLDRASDSAQPDIITSSDCVHLTAGTYVLFAKSPDSAQNGGLPAGSVFGTFKFSLVAGSAAAPGDVRIVAGATVVDSITWTKSVGGKALQLDPDLIDATSNDAESNFCNATASYGLGDFGTPNAVNGQCALLPPAGKCDDNGTLRAIVKPAAGALVISEIMPNPKVEPAQEWFEITNTGAAAFDVNELGLDRAGDTRVPDVVHSAACKSIAPHGFALFARSADPASNGMLPAVDATFGFSMVNSAGDVRVLDGTTVLDAVTWTTSTDGVSSQAKPGSLTTTGNDASANFCPATSPFGDQTNKGTPKAVNAC